MQLVCKLEPLSVNSHVLQLRHTCVSATQLCLPALQLLTNLPNPLAATALSCDCVTPCLPALQLLTNLPNPSAVTTISPGVAYCVAAPDGSFYAPFCTTNHITFLQQFMDAGCADAVDVMNVHIYQ